MSVLIASATGRAKRSLDERWFETDAGLAAAVSLLLPLLLWRAGFAGLNRMLYPTTGLLLAIHFYRQRSPWFLGLCVWLFCATPFIRRITDFQVGWDPVNPVLVTPFLACSVAALSFLRYGSRTRPALFTPFAIVLGCIGYGTTLAVLEGRVVSGVIDALRWSAGPFCAVHILRETEMQSQFYRVVMRSLLVAVPLMAIYGIAQFIDPAIWDREWMTNVLSFGLDSIGQPAPFEVRVFSVLNAPASLAMFLSFGLLLLLEGSLIVAVPAGGATVVCLLLTQYRAGWGGLCVGLLCLLLLGSARIRLKIVTAVIVLAISAGSLTIFPEIENVIAERAATLTRLGEDTSGQERLSQYGQFLQQTDGLVQGHGLALSGATRQLDGQASFVIDGGLMEPFLAFGIFGGTAFLGAILSLVVLIFWARRGAGQSYAMYCAGCLVCFVQIPFGRVLMGESGFLGWLFVGLAIADVVHRRSDLTRQFS